MTLVDSRPASRRALERLAVEDGTELPIEKLMSTYGLPTSTWFPPEVDVERFRVLQAQEVGLTVEMPGATAAAQAVRTAGMRLVVITAAPDHIAEAMLAAVGLEVDSLHASVWAGGKVRPLKATRCSVFVGDHPDDMTAARAAGAVAVGVETGLFEPVGAEFVFSDLTCFPSWLEGQAQRTL